MIRCLVVALSALLLFAAPARAQDAAQHAALVLRILSYDRNLPSRSSNQVTVLVLYRSGDRNSEAEHRRMITAINQLSGRVRVAGRPARAIGVAYTNRAALVGAMRSENAAAVFVCSGLGGSVADISGAAREAHTLSMSRDGDSVRSGLGVGLVERGAQVQLVVNLRAVEAEGARLDAAVLRLAELIR